MALEPALSAIGVIRPTRRRGFCPACRVLVRASTGDGHRVELAPPALAALAFLAVGAIAWVVMLGQVRVPGGMNSGLPSLGSFSMGWTVMIAAMMLPSALPLVFGFARNVEGRKAWQAATAALGLTYLSMWLAFGLACYAVAGALPMSWLGQGWVGGVALVMAGLYGLTRIKRAGEARCRELCALHGPLPFDLMRSAVIVGARYGLSCIGCSAALMVALVMVGMSNLTWILGLSGVVLVSKFAPGSGSRRAVLLSTALVASGAVYALMA